MLTLLRPHRTAVVLGFLALGAATVLILLQPVLAGRLVDRAAGNAPSAPLAASLVVMLIGALLLEKSGHFLLDRTGEDIVAAMRVRFADHVVRLPVGALDRARTGDLLSRAASDASLLRDMPRALGDIAFGALALLGAGVFMLSIDAVTLGVVVAVVVVAFAAGSPFLSRVQRASTARQAALGEYTAGLERALGAARTVKLFGAEAREVGFIGARAGAARDAGVQIAAATAMNILVIRLGITGALLSIMVIDGRRVAAGALSVGQFVSLFAFAVYAVFPVTAGFLALSAVRTSAGAYRHLVDALQDLPEDDRPSPGAVSGAGLRTGAATGPLVEFDRVCFAYGDRPVLEDVSFTLEPDQTTALVGRSGAGKSTIVSLLCRFAEPDTGVVRWQCRDVRDIPLSAFRARLGLLEQDAPVLHGTIRDNLLVAAPDADDTELWRVLHQANVADEIARLPAGLDTAVLDRGRGLSGGQRQRLALARAYLSRSDLILMDEPTAHLDRANESDVMTNVHEARGTRSLLVIAHRLTTVTAADQILVLDRGRIQAAGTHADLLSHPVYRTLVDHELTH